MRFTLLTFMSLAMILMSGHAIAQNVNSIETRLDRIEREMQTLSRSVFKGDVPPPSLGGGGSSMNAQQAAQMEVRMNQIEEQLRRLTGMVEENSFRLRQLSENSNSSMGNSGMGGNYQPSGPSAYVNDSMGMDDGSVVSQGQQPYTLGTINNNAGMSPARLYDQAFSYLQTNDFASAQTAFEEFTRTYPDHSLAANAKYWLGETYYARDDFQAAARAFARAFKDHPDGQKAPDTLLKLAMSLRGQGMTEEACLTLAELSNRFPNAPASVKTQATQERQAYACN